MKPIKPSRLGIGLIIGGFLFAILPILIVLVAMIPANLGNCQVDESGYHPCIILGVDIGEPLATTMVIGWFALLTMPVGGGVILIGTIVLILVVIRGVAAKKDLKNL